MNVHSETQSHKNSALPASGVFILSVTLFFLGLFIGLVTHDTNAQVISLTAKQINPLFQTTSTPAYSYSILYGKLESMQRAINGLYDVCAK